MGLTFRLGQLPTSLFTDASNNIGIGGAANASFKLQVTGTTNLTGVLTLGSTITNGTYTYTLPSATGTLALTSNIPSLSGYVPYTGATTNVVLGTNNLKSNTVYLEGNGFYNGGSLKIKQYSSQADGEDGYNSISSQTSGFAFSASYGGGIFKNFILDPSVLTNTTQRSYTLPNASGTIALTSNLSSYLPLTGGTLTGALTGTSATFSASTNGEQSLANNNPNSGTSAISVFNLENNASVGQLVYTSSTYTGGYTGIGANTYALINRSATGSFKVITGGYTDANTRFTIASTGNVGIGTIEPSLSLDIKRTNNLVLSGTGFRVAQVTSTSGVNADLPGIILGYDSSGGGIIAPATQAGTVNFLGFWTYNGSWAEKLRITKQGDVGINTISPGDRFDVNGNIRSSGNSTILRLDNTGGTAQSWWVGQDVSGANDGIFYIFNATSNTQVVNIKKGLNNVLVRTTNDNGQGTFQNPGSAFLGGLQVGGVTFSTSITATNNVILYYFNGGSAATLTLPSTIGCSSYYVIKNGGTALLTVTAGGSGDKIMGYNGTSQVTSISIAQGQQGTFISNGANVWIQVTA